MRELIEKMKYVEVMDFDDHFHDVSYPTVVCCLLHAQVGVITRVRGRTHAALHPPRLAYL